MPGSVKEGIAETVATQGVCIMLAERAICDKADRVHREDDPMLDQGRRSEYPTKDEQIYRISGTTSGSAIFGAALATAAGGAAIAVAGAVIGGLLGFGIAAIAASHAVSRKA